MYNHFSIFAIHKYIHYDDTVQYMMKRCPAVIGSSVTMLSSWAAMQRGHVRTAFTRPGQTGHAG